MVNVLCARVMPRSHGMMATTTGQILWTATNKRHWKSTGFLSTVATALVLRWCNAFRSSPQVSPLCKSQWLAPRGCATVQFSFWCGRTCELPLDPGGAPLFVRETLPQKAETASSQKQRNCSFREGSSVGCVLSRCCSGRLRRKPSMRDGFLRIHPHRRRQGVTWGIAIRSGSTRPKAMVGNKIALMDDVYGWAW